MKLNWGQSITIVIILFMLFILTLVYKMHFRNADLVQDNFYEQEVLFDAKKESVFNYEKLDKKIEIKQTPNGIEILFPDNFSYDSGSVYFYRADDKSLDKTFNFNIDKNNKMVLPYSDFVVGRYEVNTNWTKDKQTYLYQTEISF